MLSFKCLAVLALIGLSFAQDYDYDEPRPAPQRVRPGYSGPASNQPRPTPVPILKQIDRHNEDGSYTYGYEAADGTFKIETKLATGEVKGKYGYVDDTGKVRTVEYGATKHGFEPAGEGITVPPPTLVDETANRNNIQDDYYQPEPQQIRAAPRPRPRPQPVYEPFQAPQFAPAPQRSAPAPVPARALVPSAVPSDTTTLTFGPPSRPAPANYPQARNFAPAPKAPSSFSFDDFEPRQAVRPQPPRVTYAQPAPLPSQFAPESRPPPQRYAPAPDPAPRPAASGLGRSGGILDQLSKDYALPEGGAAPLHDISFGYY